MYLIVCVIGCLFNFGSCLFVVAAAGAVGVGLELLSFVTVAAWTGSWWRK